MIILISMMSISCVPTRVNPYEQKTTPNKRAGNYEHLTPSVRMNDSRLQAQPKLTLNTAVCYALRILDLVAPNLMRPAAASNIAALMDDRYEDVQLPDINDVIQQVHRQVAHRP